MSPQPPRAVAMFFATGNSADTVALRQCFTRTAVVADEGHRHLGREAIAAGVPEAQRRHAHHPEPQRMTQEGTAVRGPARAAGSLPGSPVEVTHVPGMSGDEIAALEIQG